MITFDWAILVFLLNNLTFKCQRISLAFLTRYGRVMPSTYHEVIRLCIHDKKLSFMTSQVCACVLLSLYIINKIKLNNISNNKITKPYKTQRHQSASNSHWHSNASFWRHSTSSFMSEICSDKWQERGEREQLIEWKWIAWSQFHHSWFVMIRDDACLAALPVEIYLLFDFNMFNSVIFVVMVKKWWKWTPWKGENSVAQQTTYNLHQSTSNYRSLHNVAVPVFHVAICILGTSGTLASWPPTPGNQHSTEQNQRQCFIIWIHSTCFAWRVPTWAPCVPPLANRHSQSRDLIRHFKFSIPCQVFCIHSRCPRTLSLLQKFRQKHLRFKPAFTSSARMFRRILVQSILGSDRTFAWKSVWWFRIPAVRCSEDRPSSKYVDQGPGNCLTSFGSHHAPCANGTILPHVFRGKENPYKQQLQNAREVTLSTTQNGQNYFWMNVHKGHTNIQNWSKIPSAALPQLNLNPGLWYKSMRWAGRSWWFLWQSIRSPIPRTQRAKCCKLLQHQISTQPVLLAKLAPTGLPHVFLHSQNDRV